MAMPSYHLPPHKHHHSHHHTAFSKLSSTTGADASSSSPPPPRHNRIPPLAILLGLVLASQTPSLQPAALAFGWFPAPPAIEKDPVQPFTLYGSVFKKYFIEKIVDGRVVSRKKGFTSTACVNALDANKETPELQRVPAGLKVVIIGEPVCAKNEGQTREDTCIPSCKNACTGAISHHLAEVKKETGYTLDLKDAGKAMELCSTQCANECEKPGKITSFIYPFRPSK